VGTEGVREEGDEDTQARHDEWRLEASGSLRKWEDVTPGCKLEKGNLFIYNREERGDEDCRRGDLWQQEGQAIFTKALISLWH
jgi:hypothetical protein